MFMTPKREFIIIMGTEIQIEINHMRCVRDEADGLFSSDEDKIILKSYYDSEDHYKRVFFHECFHAMCDILGCQLDDSLEEVLAHSVSKLYLIFPH